MSQGGRPRKVRSRPTSGVGGRLFTTEERDALLEIGEDYGLDPNEDAACHAYLTRLWEAFGSYLATEVALDKQVGAKEELFDLETLLLRARRVAALIRDSEYVRDAHACIRPAADLADSLRYFPNMIAAQLTAAPDWEAFNTARRTLETSILRIRLWDPHRTEYLQHLETLIRVCEAAPLPRFFTKRPRQARDMFASELAELYVNQLHPLRVAIWRETREERDDPPLPKSTEAFAHAVMKALGVRFEVKKVSGEISPRGTSAS